MERAVDNLPDEPELAGFGADEDTIPNGFRIRQAQDGLISLSNDDGEVSLEALEDVDPDSTPAYGISEVRAAVKQIKRFDD